MYIYVDMYVFCIYLLVVIIWLLLFHFFTRGTEGHLSRRVGCVRGARRVRRVRGARGARRVRPVRGVRGARRVRCVRGVRRVRGA